MTESIDQAYQVREKLAQLQEALLASTPNMPELLREIHRELKADPDVVTILTEPECAILVQGLMKQTSIAIATSMVKKKPKKSLKSMTLADL